MDNGAWLIQATDGVFFASLFRVSVWCDGLKYVLVGSVCLFWEGLGGHCSTLLKALDALAGFLLIIIWKLLIVLSILLILLLESTSMGKVLIRSSNVSLFLPITSSEELKLISLRDKE